MADETNVTEKPENSSEKIQEPSAEKQKIVHSMDIGMFTADGWDAIRAATEKNALAKV